jgi:hypothetical protein
MMITRCPHCGTANRVRSNYCNNCGADLRGETATRPDPQAPAEATPPSPPDETETTPPALPDDLVNQQPWLQSQSEGEEEPPPAGEESPAPPRRLIAHVQGLLEPVRLFNEAPEKEAGEVDGEADEAVAAPPPRLPSLDLSAEQIRRLRVLMSEEPLLVEAVRPPVQSRLPALRLPWLFLLVGALVILSFMFGAPLGEGSATRPWPGVTEAFAAVDALPIGAPVLLVWGYDPATAGELDLLALPLVAHLRARQSQPLIVSLLPNGLATARRLFAQVVAGDVTQSTLRLSLGQAEFDQALFLPGGATTLPLLGQDLAAGFNQATPGAATLAAAEEPALVILLAAQAEDVQEWVEQVQPLNRLPVVAFTSAAADPVLRPYLASGQLTGLVSGFDGASAYADQGELPLGPENEARLARQRTRQVWGQAAILLAILLGNVAAFFGSARHG